MQYEVFSIRDRKANAFMRPFYGLNIGQTVRSFQDEINREDQNNDLFKHPEDFDLYHLGQWDEEFGTHSDFEQPRQIAIGEQLKYRSK